MVQSATFIARCGADISNGLASPCFPFRVSSVSCQKAIMSGHFSDLHRFMLWSEAVFKVRRIEVLEATRNEEDGQDAPLMDYMISVGTVKKGLVFVCSA